MKKFILLAALMAAAILMTLYWLQETPGDCYTKAFAIGASVCHQIPSHSFTKNGIQFPLCARCTGLYLSSTFGLIYLFSQGRKKGLPKREYLLFLLLLALTWAGDGLNSLISDFLGRPFLYETTNLIRLITGSGMGLVMSTTLVTLFNVTIWQGGSQQPVLHHPGQILLYFSASATLAALLFASGQFAFQILAGIAILTVMAMITLLYTIFWVILTRSENKFTEIKGLVVFLIAGFGTALGQVLLLNLLRAHVLG